LIENAGAAKSPQEKFITRFARIYTPAVVAAAFLVFLIPTLLGAEAAIWFKRSLVFLIVSCPCALVISIPLTFFISIGIAAKKGIIVKGSGYLDILRQVRTIVFDKTGTLTTGEMQIDKVYVNGDINPEVLLEVLWLCEYNSSHPFSRAIKKAYQGSFDSKQVKAYSEFPGKGLILIYGQDRLVAGSDDFFANMGFLDLINPANQSVVHLAKNGFYLGCITFSDEVKPGMKEAIEKLKKQGIKKTVMLSGDRAPKAEKVAKELGIDEFYAELLPEEKLAKLEDIINKNEGKTAFVGDGLNDAPALARADVGIAMGGIGNQASIESADIVLLNDRPHQLVEAFTISRQTGNMVIQNIVLALGIKVLIMILGILGIAGLWEAVLGDVGVTILVIFNSLRLLRYKADT
ncbi:MAG TPA: heavy metal translocating P-type ATPase, partial [Candidatus Syntrophosphaera thermopropionivorans]|nr:heavy metal translocating P-type ATPase [Candidatus Syntrophosphaera thermopropionivorans]